MFETSSEITHQPHITADDINALNAKYKSLSAKERIIQLYLDFEVTDVMLTSSFAATSAFFTKVSFGCKQKSRGLFYRYRLSFSRHTKV